MGDIVNLGIQSLRSPDTAPRPQGTPPAAVLAGALERADELQLVVIAGINADGSLFLATTTDQIADSLLTLDRVRRRLLEIACDGDMFG
jgi:hypothetical protein